MESGIRISSWAADDPDAAALRHAKGGGFPFRDILVARTYEPLADAAATLVARALAARLDDVAVSRTEDEALERQAKHAALAIVGTPRRRRSARMPGGDPILLAQRLRIPVVVVAQRCSTADLRAVRSIVCGVRDASDVSCVAAAGVLADALDLQLALVHVWEQPQSRGIGLLPVPPRASAEATPEDRAAGRELLSDVARRAARTTPGAACHRVIEGPPGQLLCAAGRDHRAAMIALTAPRHRPSVSALLGSAARHVIRHADRPVLICPRDPDPALALPSQTRRLS
jgi:nucleotide-binding universal stress UspA family protein